MNANLVGLKQLKIMIKTSIPGNDEYIDFTSDLLDVKKTKSLSKLPFFLGTQAYPRIKLQNFSYERIVEFFFNKSTFQKRMRSTTRKRHSETKIKEIKIANLELTLRLLFPTNFPLVNNIDNSLEYIVPTKNIFTLKGSNVFNVLPRRFNRKFSYLNIGSEIYTITKTVWNNDVMNHPVYSEIIKTYKEFDLWKSDPSNNFINADRPDEENAMNDILTKVFEKVQKSNENPLFKPMYPNSDKAPYSKKTSMKDDNILSIEEFDNAVKTIMQKDDKQLTTEVNNYYTECKNILEELKKELDAEIKKKELEKLYSTFKINVPMEDKIINNYYKGLKELIPNNKDKVENLIDFFYKINENELNIQKYKKNKNSSNYSFYNYFEKIIDIEKQNNLKIELLKKDKKYKLELINLLGKLAIIKNTHNVSPDLISLIDYLNINITNKFNVNRNIYTFVNDLNIKFLSDPKYKKEKEAIEKFYVEFYNLALIISNLKGRIIDNPVWNSVITDMKNGTLKNNDFDIKLWKPIKDCYNFEDEDEDEDENKNKEQKKKIPEKKGSCNSDIIEIGLDIISSNEKSSKEDEKKLKSKIQTIEVYLQVDLIEGKIDESNMDKIKCSYDDEFLGSMFQDLMNTGNKNNAFPSQQVFFSAKKLLEESSGNKTKKNGGTSTKKNTTKKK